MSRKAIACLVVFALAAYALFTALTSMTPLGPYANGRFFNPPCDFSLRMTEIKCLRLGVDPFDVWSGKVVMPPFKPNWQPRVEGPEFTEGINAYAPWEYTLMMPLSFLPRNVAWGVYWALMMLSLAAVFAVAWRFGRRRGLSTESCAILAAAPIVLAAYPAWSNVCIGNFSVIVLFAVVMMAVCLNSGRDALAGLFWALAMVKPQAGLVFAVPLLMKRRFLTCAVAAATCAAATLLPSAMCGASPLKLIVETPKANAFMFQGCGTLPYFLAGFPGDVFVALAVGVVVCWLLVRKVSQSTGDWFFVLMPAAACSAAWTYASTYGHVMSYFVFFAIVLMMLESGVRGGAGAAFALAVVFSTRIYNAFHGFTAAFPGSFPEVGADVELHRHLDSLNSLADLAICALAVALLASRARGKTEGGGR